VATLLREYLALTYDKAIVKEAKEQNKPVVVKALLQRADALNQKGRVYPRPILEREVVNYKKAIQEGRATGELDHPDSSVVSLQNVSHILRDVWWQGDDVMGTVEVLNTPKGKIALDLMEAGVKLGISSRGVGETIQNEEGHDVVDESFMLVAFDLVSEPSTHEAWLMKEGKEVSIDLVRKMVPKVDRINRLINEILRKE
jgi:hypothetical protein